MAHGRKKIDQPRIGLAFQGGSFLAGAVGAGVVRHFVEHGIFRNYRVAAYSGTSAGALLATLCWDLALRNDIEAAPEILKEFWLYNANGTIPSQEVGDFLKSFDQLARSNPAYDYFADHVRVPMIRRIFQAWIASALNPLRAVRALVEAPGETPRLALGAANVLTGDIVTFLDQHLLDDIGHHHRHPEAIQQWRARAELRRYPHPQGAAIDYAPGAELLFKAVMASGSLDETNGMTSIDQGLYHGTYIDGAWAQNPPLDVMIDFGVDEIWLVEIFPKYRNQLPGNHAEREDRREELAQNAVVEQQIRMIERINNLIAANPGLRSGSGKTLRHIEVRRLPMTLDFTPGARLINTRQFLLEMMDYGDNAARRFTRELEAAT